MATKEEILKHLSDGVVNYQEEEVKEWSQKALDEGIPALLAIMGGWRQVLVFYAGLAILLALRSFSRRGL